MKRINHRNARKIMWALFGAAFILPLLFNLSDVALTVGIVLLLGGVAVLALYWRCPHCGRSLGREGGISFCPHCGQKLD